MKTWEHPLWSNADNFSRMNSSINMSTSMFDRLRTKVIAWAAAILMTTATPVWSQEASDVIFSVDKELLLDELGDEDSYNYYINLLSSGDVHSRLWLVFQDIRETTWFHIQGIDITFFLDLDAARYSWDDILWRQAYEDIIHLYSSFSEELEKILTEHWYNPNQGELA